MRALASGTALAVLPLSDPYPQQAGLSQNLRLALLAYCTALLDLVRMQPPVST